MAELEPLGVYSFSEAARYCRLTTASVRAWFLGRSARKNGKPIFIGDYPKNRDKYEISFYDLVDVYIAGHLRETGVPYSTLRRAYLRLAQQMHTKHSFCRQELLTQGKELLLNAADAEEDRELIEALASRKVFAGAIVPFLKQLDYDEKTKLAKRWRIAEGVVLDPNHRAGRPIIATKPFATAILSDIYYANHRDEMVVGDLYNLRPEDVRSAVAFERSFAK